jgi:hypothetical protein
MVGIERHQPLQVRLYVRSQEMRRAMRLSTVHDAVPDGVRRDLRQFVMHPSEESARRCVVGAKIECSVEERNAAAVDDPHPTAGLTDSLDLAHEHQLLGSIHVVNRSPEARGAGVNRQDSQTLGVGHLPIYSRS